MTADSAPARWTWVLTLLAGGRPPLPLHRSSIVHRLADTDDELDELDEQDELPSSAELARQLGISRAGALYRLRSVSGLPLEVALREVLKAPQQRQRTGALP